MELLVVIAVIVILVALLVPGIGMARAAARQKQCASNLVQIWNGWTRCNSRDIRNPIRGPQWTTRMGAYLEGSGEVFYCPDDTARNQTASYGLNSHAWRFGAQDSARIVLLDFNATEATVVGQTWNQINGVWPTLQAPRHFQQQNLAFYDGHVSTFEPSQIDPRQCNSFDRFWRPFADSNIHLTNCTPSGVEIDSADTTSGPAPASGTTTSETTSTGNTTGGGTTTGGTTTGGTSTGTTSGTTTGTTTGNPEPPEPERRLIWSTNHESGNNSSWNFGREAFFDNGTGHSELAQVAFAKSGSWVLKQTLTADGSSGARSFITSEQNYAALPDELYATSYLYLPADFPWNKIGDWWNLQQLKERLTVGSSPFVDPTIYLSIASDANGPYLYIYNWILGERYWVMQNIPNQPRVYLPLGKWIKLEWYTKSKVVGGATWVKQDGVLILDRQNMRTITNDDYVINWSVDCYAGAGPGAVTYYWDDLKLEAPE